MNYGQNWCSQLNKPHHVKQSHTHNPLLSSFTPARCHIPGWPRETCVEGLVSLVLCLPLELWVGLSLFKVIWDPNIIGLCVFSYTIGYPFGSEWNPLVILLFLGVMEGKSLVHKSSLPKHSTQILWIQRAHTLPLCLLRPVNSVYSIVCDWCQIP